ncbi:MAG: winged helix-turn-helix domain-containing protein [Candidatus Odinarchaeota archaeon]|nr:winged helix-turn-helix domain-containing protein [Candidatus Thorarchaeota archaeon]
MRSRILENLNKDEWRKTSNIVEKVSITSSTVLYHLRNMEREDVVERSPNGEGWRFTPIQQMELTEYLTKKSRKK